VVNEVVCAEVAAAGSQKVATSVVGAETRLLRGDVKSIV
jgi:hypothetical protein